jgi:hypothetical protein
MCYDEWEEELKWDDEDEEEKIPVDIVRLEVEPTEIQEPAAPEAA